MSVKQPGNNNNNNDPGIDTGTWYSKQDLSVALALAGFDICHAFHPKLYNDCIQEKNLPLQPLPTTTDDGGCLAYLIGNTKHFWPIFLKWYKQQQQQQKQQRQQPDGKNATTVPHPIDTYTTETITSVLNQTFHSPSNYHVYWSHDYSMDRLVSMQRVASCSGFAYLDEISHLTVHPVYGTWHSFRAVVIVNTNMESSNGTPNEIASQEPPPPPPSIIESNLLQPCLLTDEEHVNAKLAMEKALQMSDEANNLCDQLHGGMASEQVAKAWIQLRDCIVSRGQDYRFEENQLWYHYTKDVKYLEAALEEMT